MTERKSQYGESPLKAGNESCGPSTLSSEVEQVISNSLKQLKGRLKSLDTLQDLIYREIDTLNKSRSLENMLEYPTTSVILKESLEIFPDLGQQYNSINNAQTPLEKVTCQLFLPDIYVKDDRTGEILGRPKILLLLDDYSGYPLGFHVEFDFRSSEALMLALKHAILPKDYVAELYPDVQNSWQAYGIPSCLVLEQSSGIFISKIENACEKLGIKLFFSPPHKKATKRRRRIDHFFSTLSQELQHSNRITIFSEVAIGFKSLLNRFHMFLIDEYSANADSGTTDSPITLWIEGVEKAAPLMPSNNLDHLLTRNVVRTVYTDGIRYKYLRYNSTQLLDLKMTLQLRGFGNRISFRYDSMDISRIFVRNPVDGEFFEVPCIDQEYTKRLSEYEHESMFASLNRKERNVPTFRRRLMRIIK